MTTVGPSTMTTTDLPVVRVRSRGQALRDEILASFVIGIGMLAIMSAFGAQWGLFGAGVGFAIGQAIVALLPFFHGAHGNPFVTTGSAVARDIAWSEAAVRWVGQAVGWSLVVPAGIWFYGTKAFATNFGVVRPSPYTWPVSQFFMPLLLVLLFVLPAILLVNAARHHLPGRTVPFLVLSVWLGVLVYWGAAYGTGINGMREVVPMFAAWFATGFRIAPFFWVPVLGGLVGAVIAGLVWLLVPHQRTTAAAV